MPVVRNVRGFKPHIWIPPTFSAIYKFTITRSNGTVDDLTNVATMINVEDGVTETIGTFKFVVWNPNGTYTDVWQPTNIVLYYKDYATTATTLRFRGRVEKVAYEGTKVVVSGRSESLRIMEITVTKAYDTQEASVILKDLLSAYATYVTQTNINTSSIFLTVNWFQKPFWECIKELCTATAYEAYLDANLDFHFFASGSVLNTTDAIVHDFNLFEVKGFSEKDSSLVKNRIIIYGAQEQGTQIIYTAEDTASQTENFVREEIINDENITSYSQAQSLGTYLLTQRKTAPIVGEISGFLLATVQPGENVRMSSPLDNLPPGNYFTSLYKDEIDIESGIFKTTLTVNKEPRSLSHIFSQLAKKDTQKQKTSINPYEMRYSYNFLFDTDEGSHSNTQITTSVLKLQAGQSTGTWISPARNETSEISEVYLLAIGQSITGATFSVSGDNGVNYENITNRNKIVLGTSKGKVLRIKVSISDTATQLDSLSVMYKF